MDETKIEKFFETAAGDLAAQLAEMHGTLMNLIHSLRGTPLSDAQRWQIDQALNALRASQQRFMSKYGDMIGGADPGRN